MICSKQTKLCREGRSLKKKNRLALLVIMITITLFYGCAVTSNDSGKWHYLGMRPVRGKVVDTIKAYSFVIDPYTGKKVAHVVEVGKIIQIADEVFVIANQNQDSFISKLKPGDCIQVPAAAYYNTTLISEKNFPELHTITPCD